MWSFLVWVSVGGRGLEAYCIKWYDKNLLQKFLLLLNPNIPWSDCMCVLHFMCLYYIQKQSFHSFGLPWVRYNDSWIFLQSQVYKQQDFPTTWSAWKGSCWCYQNSPKQGLQKAKINFCSYLRQCESFYKGSSAVTDSIHGSLSPVLLWRHQIKWW